MNSLRSAETNSGGIHYGSAPGSALLAFAVLLSCSAATAAAEEAEEWGYEEEIGPAHWSRLQWEYAICELGVHQSPIDLSDANEVRIADMERFSGDMEFDVERKAQVLDLLDNGHTVQFTSNADIGLTVDGERYGLLQFHFHAPSEHTIDGRHFPLETHFVMGSEEGHLAVLGYLYEEGAADPDMAPIVAALPQKPGDQRRMQAPEIAIEKLKPLQRDFYTYSGSLTTPPCSEGVRWMVAADPLTLSAEQLKAFDDVLHNNNRPVQPRHVRSLLLVEAGKQ